jgi:hypothetical protein
VAKVPWHVTMPLDGFISGPNDAREWVFGYIPTRCLCGMGRALGSPHPAGSVLRRQAQLRRRKETRAAALMCKVLGGAWSGPVFVLTQSAPR